MNVYNQIRKLPGEYKQALWIAPLRKCDVFTLCGKAYQVITKTPKTFRIKNIASGKSSTFKKINGYICGDNNLLRDAEAELTVDLLNQFNPFHQISDIFKLTSKVLHDNTL